MSWFIICLLAPFLSHLVTFLWRCRKVWEDNEIITTTRSTSLGFPLEEWRENHKRKPPKGPPGPFIFCWKGHRKNTWKVFTSILSQRLPSKYSFIVCIFPTHKRTGGQILGWKVFFCSWFYILPRFASLNFFCRLLSSFGGSWVFLVSIFNLSSITNYREEMRKGSWR